jgi:hypothetical protein
LFRPWFRFVIRLCGVFGTCVVVIVIGAALPVFFPDLAVASRRVALVVANEDYANTNKLQNPVNDAGLISEQLARLNFEIQLYSNVTAQRFKDIVERFAFGLDSDTVAVFYYAGHGLQYKGENLLVGTNAQLASESDCSPRLFDLAR